MRQGKNIRGSENFKLLSGCAIQGEPAQVASKLAGVQPERSSGSLRNASFQILVQNL